MELGSKKFRAAFVVIVYSLHKNPQKSKVQQSPIHLIGKNVLFFFGGGS